jgi:hypothetical protein
MITRLHIVIFLSRFFSRGEQRAASQASCLFDNLISFLVERVRKEKEMFTENNMAKARGTMGVI